MRIEWPAGTVRLLTKELVNPAAGSDFVAWAVDALSDGFDTPSLCRLAGLDLQGPPSAFEAADMFRQALAELRIDPPDSETLVREYAGELAQQIVDGAVSPQAGAALIHREILSPFDHPAELAEWCYLDDGRDPETYETLGQRTDQVILETALKWAGRRTRR